MNGWFQFGQLDSTDYDLLIFEKAVDRAPMWGQSAQEVPGRNGELLIPTQRMPNVERIYTAVIVRDIENNIRALRNALAAQAGYHPDGSANILSRLLRQSRRDTSNIAALRLCCSDPNNNRIEI